MRNVFFILLIALFVLISSTEVFAKTYWLRGMGIGALSGAVAGGGAAAGIVATDNCSSMQDSSDRGICGALKVGLPIGMTLGGALVGAGIGAAIGSAFEKPEKVALLPYMIYTKEGLNIGLNFRLQEF